MTINFNFTLIGAAAGAGVAGLAVGFCLDGLVYVAAHEFAKEFGKQSAKAVVDEVVRPALRQTVETVKRVVRNVVAWFKNLWAKVTGKDSQSSTTNINMPATAAA